MARYRSPKTKAADEAYRAAHREEAKARVQAWAKANPEKRRASERTYRAKNKDKIRAQKKAWRNSNSDVARAANRRWKINRLLRLRDYHRLVETQGARCAICESESPGRRGSTRHAIDHCHSTGKVRGLLCHPCNALIGLAKDDIGILAAAILYLQEHQK